MLSKLSTTNWKHKNKRMKQWKTRQEVSDSKPYPFVMFNATWRTIQTSLVPLLLGKQGYNFVPVCKNQKHFNFKNYSSNDSRRDIGFCSWILQVIYENLFYDSLRIWNTEKMLHFFKKIREYAIFTACFCLEKKSPTVRQKSVLSN